MKMPARLVSLIFLFLSTYVMTIFVHEFAHLIANINLGGQGAITVDKLTLYFIPLGGHMDWMKNYPLPNHIWVVYLSGGLGAAILWFPRWWIAWRTPTHQDDSEEAIYAGTILTSVLYAPTELILYYGGIEMFNWAYQIAYAAGIIIFAVLYMKKMVNWLDAKWGCNGRNGKKFKVITNNLEKMNHPAASRRELQV